ncbi:MAG TPA: hypothetical protein VI300_30605 [Solirubrobacter sp.]
MRGTHRQIAMTATGVGARTSYMDTKKDQRDDANRPGAEGGESDATHRPPAAPADDDSPLGDTDQHSNADA